MVSSTVALEKKKNLKKNFNDIHTFFFFWVMEGKLSLDWLVVCSLPSPARIFYGGGFKIPHPNPHDNSFNKMAIKKNKKFANMPSLDDCQRCPQLRYRRGDGQR